MTTTLQIQDETNGATNYILTMIRDCVGFWNREGRQIYEANLSGKLGDKETNAYARQTHYDDWLLEMMLIDCNTFTGSDRAKSTGHTFEAGRTRSHVWFHMDNERVFLIHTS